MVRLGLVVVDQRGGFLLGKFKLGVDKYIQIIYTFYMEKRTPYTVVLKEIDYRHKLLRLPTDLLDWFKVQAPLSHHSVTALMVRALERYQEEIEANKE